MYTALSHIKLIQYLILMHLALKTAYNGLHHLADPAGVLLAHGVPLQVDHGLEVVHAAVGCLTHIPLHFAP